MKSVDFQKVRKSLELKAPTSLRFKNVEDRLHIVITNYFGKNNRQEITIPASKKIIEAVVFAMSDDFSRLESLQESEEQLQEKTSPYAMEDIFINFVDSGFRGKLKEDFITANGIHYFRMDFYITEKKKVFFCLKRNIGFEALLRSLGLPYNKKALSLNTDKQ